MTKIVVIKFGGNALTKATGKAFCSVVSQLPKLGYSPVVVHGGGPQINEMLSAVGIESKFVNGMRYTDKKTLNVAEMVLSGQVNKMLVQYLGDEGADAVGISGKDSRTLIAEQLIVDDNGESIDLGYVGQIKQVNTRLLNTLISSDYIPVIAPLAYGNDEQTYNINADYAAAKIATALSAEHFVMMTNIEGLLDADKNIIHRTNQAEIDVLIDSGVIAGGMIPKTRSALDSLVSVNEVNIIDGREANNLKMILSGERIGTTITR